MNPKVKRLTRSGILGALTLVLTLLVRIPMPLGYLNLGDAGVFLCAMLLPMPYAPLAAATGSMLSDLIGYPQYAPITFVIKGGAVLLYWLLDRAFRGRAKVVSAAISSLLIPLGYFCYESILYGAGAVAGLLPNLVQGLIGAILAYCLYAVVKNVPFLKD